MSLFQTKSKSSRRNSVNTTKELQLKYNSIPYQNYLEETFNNSLFTIVVNGTKYTIPKSYLARPIVLKSALSVILTKPSKKEDKIELEVDTIVEKQFPIYIDLICNPNGPPPDGINHTSVALALIRFGIHFNDIFNYIIPDNVESLTIDIFRRISITCAEALILFDPLKEQTEFVLKSINELKEKHSNTTALQHLKNYYSPTVELNIQQLEEQKNLLSNSGKEKKEVKPLNLTFQEEDEKKELQNIQSPTSSSVKQRGKFNLNLNSTKLEEKNENRYSDMFSPRSTKQKLKESKRNSEKYISKTPRESSSEKKSEIKRSKSKDSKRMTPVGRFSKTASIDNLMSIQLISETQIEKSWNEKVYNEEQVKILQHAVSGYLIRKKYSIVSLKKRRDAFKELVETEQSLLKNMKLMDEYFAIPLQQSPMSYEIFGLLNRCIDSSQKVLDQFEKTLSEFKYDTLLGETINTTLKFITPLLEYSVYYSKMENKWKHIKITPLGKSVIQKASEAIQPQTLEQLLIQPVQRTMRYPMMIEVLMKSTSIYNPDYSQLKDAHSGFHQFCQILNERTKMREKLIEIANQHQVEGLIIHGRFHLFSAECNLKENKKKYPSNVVLCNDKIFFFGTKEKKNTLFKSYDLCDDLNVSSEKQCKLLLFKMNEQSSVKITFKKQEDADEFSRLIQWSISTCFYKLDDESNWLEQIKK